MTQYIPFLGIYPEQCEYKSTKNVYTDVHSRTVNHSQKAETTQMFHQSMNGETKCGYPHNGTLFSLKNK